MEVPSNPEKHQFIGRDVTLFPADSTGKDSPHCLSQLVTKSRAGGGTFENQPLQTNLNSIAKDRIPILPLAGTQVTSMTETLQEDKQSEGKQTLPSSETDQPPSTTMLQMELAPVTQALPAQDRAIGAVRSLTPMKLYDQGASVTLPQASAKMGNVGGDQALENTSLPPNPGQVAKGDADNLPPHADIAAPTSATLQDNEAAEGTTRSRSSEVNGSPSNPRAGGISTGSATPPGRKDRADQEKVRLPLPGLPALRTPAVPGNSAPAPAPAPTLSTNPWTAQSFDASYKSLNAPSNWSLSLGLVGTGTTTLPRAARDCFSLSGMRSFLMAHVFTGIIPSGRGKHYGDIKRAFEEQEDYWSTIDTAPHTDSLLPQLSERCALKADVEKIHRDMLKAISILKQALEHQKSEKAVAGWQKTVVAKATAEHVLRTIKKQHDQLFDCGRRGAPPGPASEVSKALGELIELRVDRHVDPAEVSALVAQLIVDQATIIEMATLLSGGSGEVANVLEKREESNIAALRKAGFISLRQADYVIRALDYISTGLAKPWHKLNRALDPISDFSSRHDALMGVVASMAVGEEVKLDGGWSRGLKFDGMLARMPFISLHYIGATFSIGPDQSYNYALTIRKEASGIKVVIGRTGSLGFDGGINSWYGFRLPWFSQKFIKKFNLALEWGANLAARYEHANEDVFSFTIPDGPDQLGHLSELLAGKIGGLDALLKIDNLSKFGSSNKFRNNVKFVANTGVGQYAAGTMFLGGTNLQGQTFPCAPGFAVEASLYDCSSERGLSLDADAGTLSRTSKNKSTNFLTHRNLKFVVGMSSTSRGRFDFAERDDLVGGPIHNIAARLQGVYTMTPASWSGLCGGHAIPECGEFSYRRGDDGKISKITWDVTLPPSGKILEHPAVVNLMETLDTTEKKDRMKDAIIDGTSFTTRENREEIQALLHDMKENARHSPLLAAKIDKLCGMSNFLSPDDRWNFRWQARALVGGLEAAPERVLSRLSGMQAQNDLGRDITRLLALTEKHDDNRWPWQKNDRTFTFKAEATAAMIAKVNESDDAEAAIRKEFSEKNNGRITGLTVGQPRTNSTGLTLPIPLLVYGSSARLTLNRKSTWSVDKIEWDRPFNMSSKAGAPSRRIDVPAQVATTNTPAIPQAADLPTAIASATPAAPAAEPPPAADAAPVAKVAPVHASKPPAEAALPPAPSALKRVGNAFLWFFKSVYEWLAHLFTARREATGANPT